MVIKIHYHVGTLISKHKRRLNWPLFIIAKNNFFESSHTNMFEQINEPIEVSVTFKDNHLLPLKFVWQDREYLVRKINLTYSRWEGRNKLYLFAVSDNANYFKLQFNSENLSWTLLESYAD